MDEKKEELIFARHLEELAKSAYYKSCCIYTDFLNLNEISIFLSIRGRMPAIPYTRYGGCEGAERVKLCFHGDLEGSCQELSLTDEYKAAYPICCLSMKPANAKFAEQLTHRDYLGAILNLGIDRSTTGDILIKEDSAFVYCDETLAPFLCDNLTRIRHTTIRTTLHESEESQTHSFETIHASVASLRLDAMLGAAFHTSRSHLEGLAPAGRVFVNGREVLQNSYLVKPGEIVSARGYGKFRFVEQGSLTKKGRMIITIEKYI